MSVGYISVPSLKQSCTMRKGPPTAHPSKPLAPTIKNMTNQAAIDRFGKHEKTRGVKHPERGVKHPEEGAPHPRISP